MEIESKLNKYRTGHIVSSLPRPQERRGSQGRGWKMKLIRFVFNLPMNPTYHEAGKASGSKKGTNWAKKKYS